MTRIRAHDALRHGERTSPPVVIWRCADTKRRHLVLRVFLDRDGWLVVRESFRVPMQEWIERAGVPYTVEDVRDGVVGTHAADARRVTPEDKLLPLNVDAWPTGVFEAGCKCGGAVQVDIAALADDCRRARDLRTQVVGNIR